ncbi:hypothetical protein [Singulisphaera acidiphila]|uniref:Carboxypeptidase regulatory-like domain-containing protein n=1 Tax=Singulisphaera acidiphila (strain ATCC BAA-1392 / DSM 18658 / VKM B-2454 / MOB10) TaxID=886293 RepID=L0DFC4_SINAD|nr:hypothetical protein [Singulisphaera acidiphila]AGA28084.1 hypothetical protein Sinac_3853 [Singulisphaera acidiphila DSM 18658]
MNPPQNRCRPLSCLVRGFAAALIATLVVGCNGEDTAAAPKIKTVPTKGTVSVDGKPVTEGIITLEPLLDGGSTTQAMGPVQSDGSFSVNSAGGNAGAMPGKYRVLLQSDATKQRKKRNEEVTVEVKEGEELKINLP